MMKIVFLVIIGVLAVVNVHSYDYATSSVSIITIDSDGKVTPVPAPSSSEDAEFNQAWDSYQKMFNKKYDNPAHASVRKAIFREKHLDIKEHNERYKKGEVNFTQGYNAHSDSSYDEISRMRGRLPAASVTISGNKHAGKPHMVGDAFMGDGMGGGWVISGGGGGFDPFNPYNPYVPIQPYDPFNPSPYDPYNPYVPDNGPVTPDGPNGPDGPDDPNGPVGPVTPNNINTHTCEDTGDPPATVDWRKKGVVTPVKNQQQCGSCYAFSATGALEGQIAIKTGRLPNLSEQNIIDCSKQNGNMGCGGGAQVNAFDYIARNGGIDSEGSYPYEAHGDRCKYNPNSKAATCKGAVRLPSGDEQALTNAIKNIGPIAIAVDASKQSFMNYHCGIYSDPTCSSSHLDHALLAVGYGTDKNGQDYYIVKNSWGTSWGENGYIRIARNAGNMCGIATDCSYPKV